MLNFAHPWLLWGLAGLALPILAHMVHRHTTRRLAFPSLRFLRISQIPRKGRNWPTDLLLLLLRLLMAAAVILSLAGPRWLPKGLPPASATQETVLLIDNSASMGGWGIPEEVAGVLPQFLESIDGPLGAATFTQQHPPGDPARAFLTGYDPGQTSLVKGDPQQAVSNAVGLFSSAQASRQLVIISDFQASDWQLATARLDSLGIALRLLPVGKTRQGNLSVQGVRLTPAEDGQLRIWAHIRNHSAQARTVQVKLQAGGDEWLQSLEMDADRGAQAQFLLPRDEYIKGKVSIGEDVYPEDNTYHFWLMAPPPRKVEFVLTPQEDEVGKEESFFLRTAIVSATANEWQKYVVTHHSFKEGQATPKRDAVFVPGLGRHLPGSQLESILQYAKEGGKVVATPGSSPAETISLLREYGFLEADYRGLKDTSATGIQPFRIAGLSEGTPLAKLFSGEAGKDLYLSQIVKHVALRPRGDSRILMSIDDGVPLILESPVGKGTLFFCATRFHASWCDLPLRNCFLPLVRELLTGFGEQPESQWPQLEVGQVLASDKGQSFDAAEPGLFQWGRQLVSVNVPREESAAETLSVDSIRESLGSTGRLASTAQTGIHEQDESSESMAHWFALLAAGLFLLESIWVRPRQRQADPLSE